MGDTLENRILEEILKALPGSYLETGETFDLDKAKILLTKEKMISEKEALAVLDLLFNLVMYTLYEHEMFLDPMLFAKEPEFEHEKRRELRDFALKYMEMGELITRENGRITIVSPSEIRNFGGILMAARITGRMFSQNMVDSEKFPRRLRISEVGLGLHLIEIDNGKELVLCRMQSGGIRRKFFEECWNNAGTKISFEQLYKVLPLGKTQKFRPSEYLTAFRLQTDDRLNRYAYVDQEEGYVYFQKHYSPEAFTKSVLQRYSNQQS